MARIVIKNDTFDIVNRIKKYDKNYFIIYNTISLLYEIHNSKQLINTFCISLGKVLDYRAIKKLRKTSVSRIEDIIKEIDEHNEKLEKNIEQKAFDETKWKAGEMFDYANKNENVDFSDAYKTSWV